MKDLLQHLAQVEQLSRTKEYANDLREIDGMLVKKLAMIGKAAYVTTCILNGEEIKKRSDLDKDLNDQRSSLVAEIGQWAAENKPKTTTRTGRKRTRTEDGVFVTKPKKAKGKKIKGETYLKTYVLVKEGNDAAAIAAERQLSVGTIHGHFAKGVGEGVLDISEVMDDATRDTIGNWMRENADKGTNDARARFGDTYSYGQLRIVQAWLKLEEGS
jgi:hypothetical protein